jgi:ribonuclease BN (tRNA processing enzyme)
LDQNVLDLIEGADLLIYDANYTDDEFSKHIGWGHSTWQEGVRLADAANVDTLVLFHHDPQHDDEILDRIGAEVDSRRPGTIVGREGLEIYV